MVRTFSVQRGRVEVLLDGEVLLLHAVEPEGVTGHADVVLDVGALEDDLVRLHAQALERGRIEAEAAHPHHHQHDEARHRE